MGQILSSIRYLKGKGVPGHEGKCTGEEWQDCERGSLQACHRAAGALSDMVVILNCTGLLCSHVVNQSLFFKTFHAMVRRELNFDQLLLNCIA